MARPLYTTAIGGQPLIDGGAPIDEVNEKFGLSLPDEDYDTLGGFILGEVGHVPEVGDTVRLDDARLVVERVDDRRVRLVRLLRTDPGTQRAARGDRPDSSGAESPGT